MKFENSKKNANYLRIIKKLNILLEKKAITFEEHQKAKAFYRTLLGADLVLNDNF